jgi:hypothetical protein
MAGTTEKSSTSIETLSSCQDVPSGSHKAMDQKDDNMPDVGQPDPPMTDDQYPHGLKLILLAGSSLISVFLIALDQVGFYLFPGLR